MGCFCVTLHLIPLRQGCSMNLEVAVVLTSSQLNTVILPVLLATLGSY